MEWGALCPGKHLNTIPIQGYDMSRKKSKRIVHLILGVEEANVSAVYSQLHPIDGKLIKEYTYLEACPRAIQLETLNDLKKQVEKR